MQVTQAGRTAQTQRKSLEWGLKALYCTLLKIHTRKVKGEKSIGYSIRNVGGYHLNLQTLSFQVKVHHKSQKQMHNTLPLPAPLSWSQSNGELCIALTSPQLVLTLHVKRQGVMAARVKPGLFLSSQRESEREAVKGGSQVIRCNWDCKHVFASGIPNGTVTAQRNISLKTSKANCIMCWLTVIQAVYLEDCLGWLIASKERFDLFLQFQIDFRKRRLLWILLLELRPSFKS